MNNIYVDELPKDCSECPMCRSGNLKLQKKGRYVEAQQCVFGQYKYQTIDDEIDTCPLKPLTDRLAEERKKVCDLVYKIITTDEVWEDMRMNWWLLNGKCFQLREILDQIERGE